MENLKTGDILLFSGHTKGPMQYFSDMIKYGTHSNYSHIAMVLKDPTYFNLSLKGIYLWESGWEGKPDPQDNKTKLGVQLTPLKEIMENFKGSKIIVRTINNNNNFTDEKLKEIHEVVYNKPYDIVPRDWIQALFRKDSSPQKTNRFWCSALVGYIYTKCGIIKSDTDWSILRPSDFSLDGERLSFINGNSLSKTETLIN